MAVLFSLWQEYRIFARLSLPEWQISSPLLTPSLLSAFLDRVYFRGCIPSFIQVITEILGLSVPGVRGIALGRVGARPSLLTAAPALVRAQRNQHLLFVNPRKHPSSSQDHSSVLSAHPCFA